MKLKTVRIPLINAPGRYALVDWSVARSLPVNRLRLNNGGYPEMEMKRISVSRAGLKIRWRAAVMLHHWVLPCHSGQVIDHVNRDKLDARRCNLRLVRRGVNQQNSGPRGSNTFKGVFRDKRTGTFTVTVGTNGETFTGRFSDETVAARVYDREALRLYGSPCYLNFPDEDNRSYAEPKGTNLKRVPASGHKNVYYNKVSNSWYVQFRHRTVASARTLSEAIKRRDALCR